MSLGSRAAEWLSRLVQVPSVSPHHGGPRAGVANERRLGDAVAGWFRDLGAEVHREEVAPDRANIYGIWRGRQDRWSAVDVHIDTVGVETMTGDPFDGAIRDDRVWGRGAVDTKASLGVALAVLEHMQQSGLTPESNILVAATVDEETGGLGAKAFAAWVRSRDMLIDQLVVAEPTLCVPVHGHKGASRIEIQVLGRSAHSATPHLGQNAITAAARVILALDAEHERLQAAPPQSVLGPPTLTVTLIHGGAGLNVVPEGCSLSIDRRVVAGEPVSDVTARLINIAEGASPLPIKAIVMRELEAFLQSADSPWLRQLSAWTGNAPSIAPYGTNAFYYGGIYRECVVIGPGSINQAHGEQEWVEIAELARMTDVYTRWWGLTA